MLLKVGQESARPPAGFKDLRLNGDGEAVLITDAGAEEAIVAGAIVASVTGGSVDGTDPANPVVKAPNGWTRVDVAENAQDVEIEVDGEAGYVLEIMGYVTNAAGSTSVLSLQPEGATSNQVSFFNFGDGSSGAATSSQANMLLLGAAGATGGLCTFGCRFVMKTGTVRRITGTYESMNGSAALTQLGTVGGRWTDTTTEIEDVTIHSDQATGIGAGSYFLWRAIPLGA